MNETHDDYCDHCWHPGTGIGSWFCCRCKTYMIIPYIFNKPQPATAGGH